MNIIVTLKCGLEVITKSLKVMVPFESLGTVSYSLSAVTMAICLANSEIFSVKNGLNLKSEFGVVQDN